MGAHDGAPVIGRSTALQVYSRQREIVDLPAPGTVWEWDSVGTSQGTLQVLRDAHLITNVPDAQGEWQTTRRLARFLADRHNIDLAAGQQQLDTGWEPGVEVSAPAESGIQVALDGTVAASDMLNKSDNRGDDGNSGEGELDDAEAGDGKDQMQLSPWTGQTTLCSFL